MGHPLDADEFTVPLKLPEVSMFWSLAQVCQILGVSRSWIRSNAVGMSSLDKPDKRKLRVVDISSDPNNPTWRVRHTELQRFLSVRNIPYS